MGDIKWGIIGCGKSIETRNGPAFNSVKNSSIQAIMRRDIEKAKQSAERLGAKKWYDNVDDLLNDNNVDIVYIATPPGLHLEQATKCCKFKKPTYIEKPFARNYAEALKITNMFKETGIPLYVAHDKRALPKFIKIKEIIDNNTIGKICEVDFKLNRKYNPKEALNTWLYNTEISGGGKFYEVAPLAIDIMVYLFGNFTDVKGIATNNRDEYKVEDVVTMIFKTDKGVIGTANFNSIAFDKKDTMIVHGTKGKMEFSIYGDSHITVTKGDKTKSIDIKNPEMIQENMIENVIQSLITGKRLYTCFAEDALETYRIIDKVLDDYYDGREDSFWRRTNTWNRKNK